MGVLLAVRRQAPNLRYTQLPEGHWLLAIILFVIVGASLPWQDFTWLTGLQALGLLLVRAIAKIGALAWSGGSLPLPKRLLVGIGIQPLSATAVFMAYEIASLYPEIGRSALPCRSLPPPSWNSPARRCAGWPCANRAKRKLRRQPKGGIA
jgi:hypothetical protein